MPLRVEFDDEWYYGTLEFTDQRGQLCVLEGQVPRSLVATAAHEYREHLLNTAPAGVDTADWYNPRGAKYQKLCRWVANDMLTRELQTQAQRGGVEPRGPWLEPWTLQTADQAYELIMAAGAGDESAERQLARLKAGRAAGDPAATRALQMFNVVAAAVGRGAKPSELAEVGAARATMRRAPVRRMAPARPVISRSQIAARTASYTQTKPAPAAPPLTSTASSSTVMAMPSLPRTFATPAKPPTVNAALTAAIVRNALTNRPNLSLVPNATTPAAAPVNPYAPIMPGQPGYPYAPGQYGYGLPYTPGAPLATPATPPSGGGGGSDSGGGGGAPQQASYDDMPQDDQGDVIYPDDGNMDDGADNVPSDISSMSATEPPQDDDGPPMDPDGPYPGEGTVGGG